MTFNKIRKIYLNFFSEKKGHKIIPSSPLVPENDPTTLFTGSGMQPLIPYLLGQEHPLGNRLTNSQKCFRAQDIEEVGDNRHTTFFEMLGNWSLGDYFKEKQLSWFFELLTDYYNIDPERLFVTVFSGNNNIEKDSKSITIWQKIFKSKQIDAKLGERIFTYPEDKNWWSRSGEPKNMPIGEPGGPDSEVFYDFGQKYNFHQKSQFRKEKCHPNCDCGRFIEIGNSVFMQYKKTDKGFTKLTQKNVDFGGGLERITQAVENKSDIFLTSAFFPIVKDIETNFETKYYSTNIKSIRIIADHVKASTFLINDGVEPSNKGQGYILRRLIRRSLLNIYLMTNKIEQMPSLSKIPPKVIKLYKDIYFDNPQIITKIKNIFDSETHKFSKILKNGIKMINKIDKMDGKKAFKLYQSYGIPLEVTKELLKFKGKKLDENEFQIEYEKHKKISKSASKGMFKGGLQDQSKSVIKLHTATHLLHKALIKVLGNHVKQMGSNITAERLRFDFSHSKKLTNSEIKKVEQIVNKAIKKNYKVKSAIMSLNRAKKIKAITLPGTKYPSKVKVYMIGDFSKEVCGGPHVDFTGILGSFKIIKEESTSSTIRRVYATVS